MLRTVLAILAGYAEIGILVVMTDQLFAALIPGFQSMSTPPLYYFGISVVTDIVYTMAGGCLCALIAREHFRRATLGLIIGGEIVGAASQIALWRTTPHWFAMALLIVYPPAIWIGSRIRARGKHAVNATPQEPTRRIEDF